MDKKMTYYITFSAFYNGIVSSKIRKKSSQDRIIILPGMDFYPAQSGYEILLCQDKDPAGWGWSLVFQKLFLTVFSKTNSITI